VMTKPDVQGAIQAAQPIDLQQPDAETPAPPTQ